MRFTSKFVLVLSVLAMLPLLRRLSSGAHRTIGARGSASPSSTVGGVDDDPSAPGSGDVVGAGSLGEARELANRGAFVADEDDGTVAAPVPRGAAPATVDLDVAIARSFLDACRAASPPVGYGLGAKVPFYGAVPGRDFQRVDCSGFVREAIRRASNRLVPFPDGSVVQHDWVRARGFPKGTVADGTLSDGVLRIAFLRPQDASSRIGHVALLFDGYTLESHGGVGPDARQWNGTGWQAKATVYVLDPAQ
jgi:hypothetical protein